MTNRCQSVVDLRSCCSNNNSFEFVFNGCPLLHLNINFMHFIRLRFRRKIYDEYNDEEVELSKEERRLIGRILKGKTPHADVDPYAVCTLIFPFH